MAEFESNRCYACKKLFCCVDCCSNHIRNKHPGRESECPLCRSEILIVRNFDNAHFMCHIVINHLPLECRSCGDLFECSSDLKSLGTCSRRLLKKKNSINEGHSVVAHGPSSLTQTPLNPVIQSKGYSIEGDYNANFESLTSPPEFTRHTSTPMHIGLSRKTTSIVFKPPRSPSFSFKTPQTPTYMPQAANKGEPSENGKSAYSKTDTPHIQKKQSSRDSNLQELLEQSESIYLSFSPSTRQNTSEKPSLKSILMSRSPVENWEPEGCKMRDLERTSADMDLTEPQGSIPVVDQVNQEVKTSSDGVNKFPPEIKDSGKRVRFSDQFEIKEEREISASKSCTSGTEEFFEARQSLSEFTVMSSDGSSGGSPDIKQKDTKISSTLRELDDLSLVKYEEGEDNEGNKENIENINNQKNISAEKVRDEGDKFVNTKVSETSRVVMMVLVEKAGASSNVDLVPLINSGLRTLEAVTTRMNSEEQPSSSSSESGVQKKLVMSVDTYKSVSTIEQYHTPSPEESHRKKTSEKSEGGGLFSAVANAVRTVFKNISEAVSTGPVMEEQQVYQNIPSIKIHPPEEVSPLSSARPSKRSREDLMSLDATEATETDSDESKQDIRSPEHKRHRGWYRQIRGREPIARMRGGSMVVSRGISNETQCFQQGSLSVGDTILPLPSRAHQSTQTDP